MEHRRAFKNREGFSLMELLIFTAIFALVIISFIVILVTVTNVQGRQSGASEVGQQGEFLIQQLQYYIESAHLVDMTQDVASTTLTLRESTSSLDPTTFTLSGGTLEVQQGAASLPAPLSSSKVNISSVSFTRHYNYNSASAPYGYDSVSYSFTMSATTSYTTNYSQTFQSSAAVLAPVGRIALMQKVKGENNSASVASTAAKFYSANRSGDLLIAVVANKGLVTTTIADTLGNPWSFVASTSYPAYTEEMSVYIATSSNPGANTTTVTFGTGASYTSLYLYEYRGASGSSPLDATGTQIQSNTSTPSSPVVNPTSSVELLFGINDEANTTGVPSAGSGYTLETSSTANNTTQVFVEDMDQYITGSVSAGWTYAGTPSSTDMILTFHQ
jgi:competence protein ComGC